MKYDKIKTIVKKFRNNPTKEEEFLWRYLSNRQLLGRKFIRQSAIIYEKNTHGEYFFYVPDFYCREEKLAVELDGKIHDYQIERDAKRDEILSSQGIRVLRIKNGELNQIQHVLDRIKACFCDQELRYRQVMGRKQT